MNAKKCTVCNIEVDQNNCQKDRNICKKCYNINRNKYNNEKKIKYDDSMNSIEKPKIDNVNNEKIVRTYENYRHVVIGPSNLGKTYYILKILEKKVTKDLFT